jgi:LuxR family maltose regulon positive regulatory protein
MTGFSPSDTPPYRLEYPYLTYARLLLAQGKLGDAQALLQTMEDSALQGERIRKLISIYLLKARLRLAQKDRNGANKCVGQALRLAVPEDYRRAFLNEGPEIIRLLPQFRDSSPTFVNELLAAAGAGAAPRTAVPPDALSNRELEILHLVAQGLSNREIAERSFVTVGTVKKHLSNIFGKLQVKSRTQAVVRGKELGLLT